MEIGGPQKTQTGFVACIGDKVYSAEFVTVVRLVEQTPGAIPRLLDLINWTCTCEGFTYRGKCKHVTKFRDMIAGLEE